MLNDRVKTNYGLSINDKVERSLNNNSQSKMKLVRKVITRKKLPATCLTKILDEWNQHAVLLSKLRAINIKITLRLLWSILAEWTIETRVSQTVQRRMAYFSTVYQKEIQTFDEFGFALRRSVDLANSSLAVLSHTLDITCQRLLFLATDLQGSDRRGFIVPSPGSIQSIPVLQVPPCFVRGGPFTLTQCCIFLAGPVAASSATKRHHHTLPCLGPRGKRASRASTQSRGSQHQLRARAAPTATRPPSPSSRHLSRPR